MEHTQKEYDHATKKRLFELEREFKEVYKHRSDLEGELRTLEHDFKNEAEDNYNYKMTIIKEQEFEKLAQFRFEMETDLDENLIKGKDEEIVKYKGEREQVKLKFKSNADLQRSLEEANQLKEMIEEANVKLELL